MEQIFRVLLTSKQLMFCGTQDKQFGSLWSEEVLSRKTVLHPRRTSVLQLKRTYYSKQWIVPQPKVIKIGFAVKLAWNIFLLNYKLEIKWAKFILDSYYRWQSCCAELLYMRVEFCLLWINQTIVVWHSGIICCILKVSAEISFLHCTCGWIASRLWSCKSLNGRKAANVLFVLKSESCIQKQVEKDPPW